MPRPLMLVLAWMLTFGLAFAGPGKYFDATIEGLDMAHAPLLPTVLALLSLLAAIYITVRRPGVSRLLHLRGDASFSPYRSFRSAGSPPPVSPSSSVCVAGLR